MHACLLFNSVLSFFIPQENYFLDDGAYSSVKIVVEMVRRRLEGNGAVTDLLADLK
jgi:hypothetical protein